MACPKGSSHRAPLLESRPAESSGRGSAPSVAAPFRHGGRARTHIPRSVPRGVETLDLFLLGGSDRAEGDGVVVDLFGRSRSGESVVARYHGFRPYFQLLDPTAETLARLKQEPDVLETRSESLWVLGRMRPVTRVVVRFPWTVPSFREALPPGDEEASVLACDIPFVHRFLYDKGLGLTVRCPVEEEPEPIRALYSVQRVVRVVPARAATSPRASRSVPRSSTWPSTSRTRSTTRIIFTLCGVVERGGVEEGFRFSGTSGRSSSSSSARSARATRTSSPATTSAATTSRCLSSAPRRSSSRPSRSAATGPPRRHGRAPLAHPRPDRGGRVVGGPRELHPKQETLEYVARTLLNDRKLDVDRRNIAEEWAKDPAAVMEYCEHDARLALHILERLRSIDKAGDLATVAHLPLEEGLNGRTSLFIDALLIPRADVRHIGVPPTHRARRDSSIEGGYVHSIRPGLYTWVVVLDFKAMYPSIIISRNLCFTTLSPDGSTVAPSGARFLPPERMRGVIPELLEELLAQRDRFRQLGREAASEELRQYLRRPAGGRQGADELVLRRARLELLPVHQQGHRGGDHRLRPRADHDDHPGAGGGGP